MKTDIRSYKDLARNSRIVIGSQWICINNKNAGKIAEIKSEPLRGLYWLDINDFVNYKDNDLFVYKQD